jgi:hypothetical protein
MRDVNPPAVANKNSSKIMIITSHMQKIIQIHPCLLKLSRKQESVTDEQTDKQPLLLYPSPLSRRDNNTNYITDSNQGSIGIG